MARENEIHSCKLSEFISREIRNIFRFIAGHIGCLLGGVKASFNFNYYYERRMQTFDLLNFSLRRRADRVIATLRAIFILISRNVTCGASSVQRIDIFCFAPLLMLVFLHPDFFWVRPEPRVFTVDRPTKTTSQWETLNYLLLIFANIELLFFAILSDWHFHIVIKKWGKKSR